MSEENKLIAYKDQPLTKYLSGIKTILLKGTIVYEISTTEDMERCIEIYVGKRVVVQGLCDWRIMTITSLDKNTFNAEDSELFASIEWEDKVDCYVCTSLCDKRVLKELKWD